MRVFVSGSSTGLGLLAGKALLASHHDVLFHARNAARAEDLRREVPQNTVIVIGDLSSVRGASDVSEQVNAHGALDAVIHNAGVGYGASLRRTAEGLPDTFAVNVLAPYVLTALITKPKRFIYLSSGMHRIQPELDDALWRTRRWNGSVAYSESKLYVTALSFAMARLWPEERSNAVDPGWVPTRMGGQGAPDDLNEGWATQVALATGEDSEVSRVSGQYLHHMSVEEPHRAARDTAMQDRLLKLCRDLSGVAL